MKNRIGLLLFVLSLLLFSACEKEELKAKDNFIIEFGSVCGWCAGEEKITVTESKVEYFREIPCGENAGKTELSRSFSSEDLNDLLGSFEYEHFLSLNYNTCNVCVDGCDEFIVITKDGETHEIRYNPGIEIEGIEGFQEKLEELLSGFKSNS